MKDNVSSQKEINEKTIILWVLGVMLIFQASMFLNLNLKMEEKEQAEANQKEYVSDQLLEIIEKE